jgi:FkbM family methyltransferase
MPLLNRLAKRLPPRVLRKLYYAPLGPHLVKIYDIVNKNNDKLEIYETEQGFKMYLSPARPGERAIIYNAYEPEVVALFTSLLQKDSIVFDIGSWIGIYALLAATKAKQVIVLEVNPDNIARIKDNISLNEGFDKVIKVLNTGASNKKTLAVLDKRESRLMDRVRVIDIPERKTDGQNSILVDTLDNIAANLDIKQIGLVMMDIEGHEIYALEGMKELLSKKAVKHLIIEVHLKILKEVGNTDAEVIQILKNSGYNVDKFHKESEGVYHIHAYS